MRKLLVGSALAAAVAIASAGTSFGEVVCASAVIDGVRKRANRVDLRPHALYWPRETRVDRSPLAFVYPPELRAALILQVAHAQGRDIGDHQVCEVALSQVIIVAIVSDSLARARGAGGSAFHDEAVEFHTARRTELLGTAKAVRPLWSKAQEDIAGDDLGFALPTGVSVVAAFNADVFRSGGYVVHYARWRSADTHLPRIASVWVTVPAEQAATWR